MSFVKICMYSTLDEWVNFRRKMKAANPANEVLGRYLDKAERTYKSLLQSFFSGLGFKTLESESETLGEFFMFLKESFPASFSQICK